MTREARFVVFTVVLLGAAVIGFLLLARQLRYGLAERPYIASIKLQLRSLAMGQAAHYGASHTYAIDVVRVWAPPAGNTAQGIRLHIMAADSSGYIAEGRSAGWDGWCVLAVGRFKGDSLTDGEPRCYRS